jgi:serine phosphatase RsbU (regulator of sigma subunit)
VAGGEERVQIDLGALLAAVEAAPPVQVVDVMAAELARMLDATSVALLIANFTGDAVVRMTHATAADLTDDGHNERAEALPLPGSVYEQVLFSQQLDVRRGTVGWHVLVPVTERGDAIGVLELTVPHHPEPEVIEYLEGAAHALAYVVVTSRRHTDLFEWAQRDRAFTLPAEIQRRLLPQAYTLEADEFTIAGWLEPAHEAGGDTFDYSLDREYLYVTVTDAMGHGIEASLLATVAIGSLRNSRRALVTPAEQARLANEALIGSTRPDQFVTGVLMRIRLADGTLDIVDAGHPRPYLHRDGHTTMFDINVAMALGITPTDYAVHTIQLEPGDRVLVVTDGVLERKAVNVDIFGILGRNRERHPREVVREFAADVLRTTGGNLLDDATVLCLDWFGGAGRRNATGGASRDQATGDRQKSG